MSQVATATSTQPTGPSTAKRRRQRSPSPPAPRKKSCEACRRAKARCNEALPNCSRCEKKGISCNYDGTRNEDSAPPVVPSAKDTEIAMLVQQGLNGADGLLSGIFIDAFATTDTFMPTGTDGAGFGLSDMYSATRVTSADSPDGAGMSSGESSDGSGQGYQTSITSMNSSESPEMASDKQWDPSIVEAHQQKAAEWDPNALPFIMRSHYREDGSKELEILPNEQMNKFSSRFLGFNIKWGTDCMLSANRVVGAFKLWPQLMIQADTLPPFIHPHFPTLQVSETTAMATNVQNRAREGFPPKLPESLANCSSICTMFYNKTPENAPFVWKNIKREQERIYEHYRKWEAPKIISSFQAMIIYSFLRMIDGENKHNDFDMAFVITITELGTSLWGDKLRALQSRKAEASQVNWSDWMLAESTCRTGMVFQFMFIMLQLYKALPPTPGCRGIDDVPLPCGRKLWQAKSYSEWQAEYTAYQESRKSNRILKFGDLMALRGDYGVSLTPEEQEDLGAWASDLDDFGNLVLIAGLSGPGSMLDDYRRTHLQFVT